MENVPQAPEALSPPGAVAADGAGPPPALELLVHGVGGVTPQEMLDDPRLVRVAGDATAGLYRRPADLDAESRPAARSGRPVQEAYSWSGLTSGNASRALWLLLLPFMIVNLAHWMRPPAPPVRDGGPGTRERLYDVLVRLLALSLTVLFVAGACEIAMDLIAWQCGGSQVCSGHTAWLGFLSAGRHGWWSTPGRRIAVAAVVPAALVGLMWLLSHRTWSAYECQIPPGTNPPGHPRGEPALAMRGFWFGRRFVARLQSTHTASAFLTVATALLLPALDRDRRTGAALGVPGWALAAAITVTALVAVVITCRHRRHETDLDGTPEHRTVRALPYVSMALVGLSALYAGWSRPGWDSHGRLPGAGMFADVTLLQGVLLAALALTVHGMLRAGRAAGAPSDAEAAYGVGAADGDMADGGVADARTPATRAADLGPGAVAGEAEGGAYAPGAAAEAPESGAEPSGAHAPIGADASGADASGAHARGATPTPGAVPKSGERVAARGYGGPLVAVLACWLGGVFTGGTAQRVADWLDGGGTPGARHDVLPGPPVLLSWQAAAIPVILLVLLAVGVAGVLRLWRDKRADAAEVRAAHPGQPEDDARTRRIAGALAMAGLTDTTPVLVAALGCGAFLLGGAGLAGAWLLGRSPVAAAAGAPHPVADLADTAQALGSWLLGAAAMALVALGRSAYGSLAARRTVGILWDVGTYWPRAAHPFAPPCYAERAVPDLTWRIATWTRATGGRLVLSAHSQGTVLAASAVWQLAPDTRRRIALLTYGSPLERLYGRWFPAYFGPPALLALHREVHAWRNLWRRTDPIGGPVRLEGPHGTGRGVDVGPLRDPAAYGRDTEHPLPAPVLAHSDYQADPAFDAERAQLLAQISGPPGGGTPGTAAVPGQGQGRPGQGQGRSGRSSG
ncbi:hypothetical protein POF50_022490 [Streptomyces sp. SL13]|uniref:Integral membrane protein n=1 Tax=Streptantibioticus silvisoli TaxID=2705255 RepID=A0AA90JZI2_9ACTN|nr:hypothetical protein [Streptantibioticus silvisoli]MDI5972071.1 hypothetical protein [Streptantibioticus silvisoli]